MRHIAINGFGRIGRIFLRTALKDKEFSALVTVVAINDMADINTLAHLFKYDSIHGKFDGQVTVDNKDNT